MQVCAPVLSERADGKAAPLDASQSARGTSERPRGMGFKVKTCPPVFRQSGHLGHTACFASSSSLGSVYSAHCPAAGECHLDSEQPLQRSAVGRCPKVGGQRGPEVGRGLDPAWGRLPLSGETAFVIGGSCAFI